jgi:hypothetical protein
MNRNAVGELTMQIQSVQIVLNFLNSNNQFMLVDRTLFDEYITGFVKFS